MRAHLMQSNNQYLDHSHTIQVQPLQWSEMDEWGLVHAGSTKATYHRLTKMGKTSNGYEYAVVTHPEYTKYPIQIFKVILRPTCCKGKSRCPIGKETIPDHPCREHLREEAERMAYEAWVQYLTALAGK